MELDLVQTALKYLNSELPVFFEDMFFSGTPCIYNAVFANVHVFQTPLKIFKYHAKDFFKHRPWEK